MKRKSKPTPKAPKKPGRSTSPAGAETPVPKSRGAVSKTTQRTRAEQTFAAKQSLLDSLIAVIPDLVYFKDRQSRFIRINEAYIRRAGMREVHTAPGKTDFDIFGEQHARQAYEDEQRIMATGQPMINKEEREDWPDGRLTWVTSTKLPLFDHHGKIIGIMGISRDITERKQAEEALRDSERRLREVLRSTRCILNFGEAEAPEGWRERAMNELTIFRWNFPVLNVEAAQEVFPLDVPPDKTYQQVWSESRHPDDFNQMHKVTRDAFLSGAPFYRNEFRCTDKHGVEHWMQEFITIHKLAENRWQLFGINTDVTDLKQVEVTLARERNLLRTILDVLPDYIYLKDEQSRFIMCNNRRADNDALQDTQELIGKTDADFFPPEQAARFRADELVVLGGKPLIDQEETLIRPSGDKQVILTTKLPFRDGNGKIIGVLGYGRDVTERKRAEQHIRKLNRVYAVLSDVNEVIVREKDSQAMLESVCRTAVEKGKFRMAWIGLWDASTGRLPVTAHAGAADDTLQILRALVGNQRPDCAFTYHALHTGQHGVCNDIGTDPQAAAWRAAALQRDYRAMASLPLKAGETVIGTFNLYADEPGFFDDEELHLLDELAVDISFALDVHRKEIERKRTEEKLAAEQYLLNSLITTTPDRIYFKDRESRFIKINEAFARMHEFSDPHMVLGKTDFDIFGEQHARQAYEDEQRIMAAGEPMIDREEREDWPDGHVTWASSTKVPLRDSSGKIVGIVGVSRDITERKRAEESHARLAKAVEQAAETIVITDTHGTILYTNPVFEKTSGYTCAEALGQNSRLLKSGRQDAEFYQRMWDVLVHGQTWSGHFVNRRKDGTLYEEEATISPVRDAAGNIVNYVAVKRDVTREVQLEAQLRQSQKMDAIGQLAGGVAHDFNNILGAMMMQAEMAAMVENTPEEVREGLHEIRAAAERAANLTRQLLLFSRRQVMQPRDLDLNEIVTSLAKMLQRIIGEDVQLQLHLHSTPLIIHADAGMLDQVLVNLAVNARDAMPGGGRLLIETSEKTVDEDIVRLNPDAVPGRYTCFSVSDTGSGIPPEVMPRIFEPFFTTKEPGKGTGLGLATVYGIVKQHQGWLKVQSEPDRGSTFQIFLPPSTATAADLAQAAARPKPRGGTETILLVEDEPAVRTLTRAILERKGYKVLEAANGVEAITVWQKHREAVSLLLTDLVMPAGVSGQQLARQIQAERPNLKVIFTSGYSAEIAGRELQLRSGENFLQKPCAPDLLLATVRQCLDG